MIHTVLIANRGEVAIRISRACAALGLRSIAVFAKDDTASLHIKRADASHALPGSGRAAYLDIAAIVEAAQQTGCDAVHPGYGFLSESAALATACEAAGLIFAGPSPDLLALFGDRLQTRQLAADCSIPTPRGSAGPAGMAAAAEFLESLGPAGAVFVKPVSGWDGRSLHTAATPAELADAWTRCQTEAGAACGQTEVYVEELVAQARRLEIQIIGDGQGGITQIGERDCTVQRCHQTLIEVAPSPGFQPMIRARMAQAAVTMARRVRLRGLCSFEFLVSAHEAARFVFIAANPGLQAAHTVTEEVYGVDLVAAQLRIAGGATLGELGLSQSAIAPPRGCAIQLRVTMEPMRPHSDVPPASGRIVAYEPPSGPGLRVDGVGYGGYVTAPAFDDLLAKVIVRAGTYPEAIARADRALQEFRLEGVATNIGFLRAVLQHPDFAASRVTTEWLETSVPFPVAEMEHGPGRETVVAPEPGVSLVATISPGTVLVPVPFRAALLTLRVAVGDDVRRGQQLAVLEALSFQHVVTSPIAGVVFSLPTNIGDILQPGQAVALIRPEPTREAVEPRGPDAAIKPSAPGFVQLTEQFPEVAAINASTTDGLVVVSTRSRRRGIAKTIGLRVLTTPHGMEHAKLVILVDETIDPFDMKQVVWALATRFHPAHDLIIIPNVADASPTGMTHKTIMDATTPVPPDRCGQCDTSVDRPIPDDWRERLMELLPDAVAAV